MAVSKKSLFTAKSIAKSPKTKAGKIAEMASVAGSNLKTASLNGYLSLHGQKQG